MSKISAEKPSKFYLRFVLDFMSKIFEKIVPSNEEFDVLYKTFNTSRQLTMHFVVQIRIFIFSMISGRIYIFWFSNPAV